MTITFGEKEEKCNLHPYDDVLVVTMQVANFRTRRILVDNGSLADILFVQEFFRMGISLD